MKLVKGIIGGVAATVVLVTTVEVIERRAYANPAQIDPSRLAATLIIGGLGGIGGALAS